MITDEKQHLNSPFCFWHSTLPAVLEVMFFSCTGASGAFIDSFVTVSLVPCLKIRQHVFPYATNNFKSFAKPYPLWTWMFSFLSVSMRSFSWANSDCDVCFDSESFWCITVCWVFWVLMSAMLVLSCVVLKYYKCISGRLFWE